MAALDSCEPQVIRALEKDGWEVVDKPYVIRTGLRALLADFTVRQLSGEMQQVIVLEVKCFANPDHDLQEFYRAQGQYDLYIDMLQMNQIQ